MLAHRLSKIILHLLEENFAMHNQHKLSYKIVRWQHTATCTLDLL